MLTSQKKGSINKGSEIFLSKKHIITQQQLSELCSQSKQSRSSNLLDLVTRTKHKLNTVTKRSNQPQNSLTTTKKLQQLQTSSNQHNLPHHTKQNNKTAQQYQMNRLYQQNQKLGYRINYLNDQNNFYRISINNIEKLNQNIHKQLDGHEVTTGVKNKINTKAVGTNGNNQNLAINSSKSDHKLSLTNAKALSSHATGLTLAAGLANHLPGNRDGNMVHPLAAGMARRSLFKVGTIPPTNLKNPTQPYPHITPTTQPQQNLKPGSGISSSFSQISNKIHLKNLQMKVGNSIRKTQKLKKIYQGSISSLTKKAQQLQTQINKLSRQAQYYQIQSQLLNNIYKADYYMHLNQDWLQLAACKFDDPNCQNSLQNNNNRLDQLKQVSDQDTDQHTDNDSDDDYAQYLKKDAHMIPKLNQYKKISAQHTITSNKPTSIHIHNTNEMRLSKGVEPTINHKKNLLMKEMSVETFPMAIRFMSGSYNHSKLGNTFKNSSYSALYNPKNRANKLSQLMGMQGSTKQTPDNPKLKLIRPSHTTTNPIHKTPSFLNPSQSPDSPLTQHHTTTDPTQQPKHMSQKQTFLLPHQMISLIISSLQKQQIQQVNKLESLRKQQRQQRKKNYQLIQVIERLAGHKERLKQLIEQEFALFFMNSVNTMETISSFTNSQTLKKGTLSTNNNNSSSSIKIPFGHTKTKPRTLHRQSSTLKLTQNPATTSKPSPWISIQQRKQQADQLYMCSLYQKKLLQSIQKQDKLLQQQYKINQQYKQKIVDRNEQENKQLKVLQEQVNKCMQQVKQIKLKYKSICQAKGKYIGSNSSMATSANALPGKIGSGDGYQQQMQQQQLA